MPTSLKTVLQQAYQSLATNPRGAATLAAQVVERQPRNGDALRILADAQVRSGAFREAAATLGRLIKLKPSDATLHVEQARALYTAGDLDAAIEAAGRAAKLDPRCPGALANWLGMRLQRGEFDAALPELAAAFERHPGDVGIAMTFGEFAVRLGRVGEAIQRLEAKLPRKDLDLDDRSIILHRLAHLYEHEKRYDEAFDAATRAKALRPARWDAEGYDRYVQGIARTFDRDFMATAPRARTVSERPVFVLGMFRSGTTLMEQILASHSAVHGAGELPVLRRLAGSLARTAGTQGAAAARYALSQAAVDQIGRDYLAALDTLGTDALRITDKHPLNFELLGVIALALPGARVIHCVRDPMDTCLSAYFTPFSPGHEFAGNLTALGRYYRTYEGVMAHWRQVLDIPLLEVRYEALVEDTEAQIRRVVDFLGLPWEDACLDFHQANRTALTPSNQQVRQPMYRSSMGRHRPFLPHLADLQRALGL